MPKRGIVCGAVNGKNGGMWKGDKAGGHVSSSTFNHADLRASAGDVTTLLIRGNSAIGMAQPAGLLALELLGGRVIR